MAQASRIGALSMLVVLGMGGVIAVPEATGLTGGTMVAPRTLVARHTVLVRLEDGERIALCAGLVWSSTVIVTAAHCLSSRPADFADLDAAAKQRAVRSGAAMPVSTINIYYRYANRWRHPRRIHIDNGADRAIVVMAESHPAGYAIPRFDMRRASEIVAHDGHRTFVSVGHTALTRTGTGELRQLATKPRKLLVQPATGFVILERLGKVGTCLGDSGAPVYIRGDNGFLRLIGMHQAGANSNADFVVPGTRGQCSRVSYFTTLHQLMPWIERTLWQMGEVTPGRARSRRSRPPH